MANRQFVVIGGDAAGMSAASLARRRQPDLDIQVFEMGEYTSYSACGMPYYVADLFQDFDDLIAVSPQEFREKRNIRVFMKHRVEGIDPNNRTIDVLDLKSGDERKVGYDDLLIATGAQPVIPEGIDAGLEGVFALRDLTDADKIKKYVTRQECSQAVIIGTGYIGMEMAEALTEAGLSVTITGRASRVMRQYEKEIGDILQKELERHKVRVINGAEAVSLERTARGKIAVALSTGETLTADTVIIGAGVAPRSELAEAAGIELGVKKAVKVNRRQQTSREGIWSAGDCAEAYHRLLGRNTYVPLALGANRQGKIAGANIVGEKAEFPGILGTAICKVFSLGVARTGLSMKEAERMGLDLEPVTVVQNSKSNYYPGASKVTTVILVEKESRKLWGAQMAGSGDSVKRIDTWAACLAAGFSLEDINALDLAYAPPYSPVWDPVLITAEVARKKS